MFKRSADRTERFFYKYMFVFGFCRSGFIILSDLFAYALNRVVDSLFTDIQLVRDLGVTFFGKILVENVVFKLRKFFSEFD